MKDERGGWKAPDTALWREHLHAATMTGRVAAARVAVGLGYAIEADPGPSGRLGHWKVAGIPAEVMELHSKRAAEIETECQRRGEGSYRPRAWPPGPPARPNATSRSGPSWSVGEKKFPRWAGRPSAWPPRSKPSAGTANRSSCSRSKTPGRSSPTCSQATENWPGARFFLAAIWSWPWPRTCSASRRGARPPGRPGPGRPRSGAPGRCGGSPRNGALAGICASPGGCHRRGRGPPVGPLRRPCCTPGDGRGGHPKDRARDRRTAVGRTKRAALGICTSGAGPSSSWVWPGPARPPCC